MFWYTVVPTRIIYMDDTERVYARVDWLKNDKLWHAVVLRNPTKRTSRNAEFYSADLNKIKIDVEKWVQKHG